jgi:hypothetical protein
MLIRVLALFATVFEGAAGICRNIGRVSQLTMEKIEENVTGWIKPLYICNVKRKKEDSLIRLVDYRFIWFLVND